MKGRPKKDEPHQVRYITTYNSRWREMKMAIEKHWDILLVDDTLKNALPQRPSLTYKRSRNLRDVLVKSHYSGPRITNAFGSKGPKWGCRTCGKCVACPNIDHATEFWNSSGNKKFQITHTINCDTIGVIYHATCPCGLIYIGLTSRPLKRRVREHVLGIEAAKNEEDLTSLKTIPKHFKLKHDCNARLLRVRGIDRILIGERGGNWRKILAQREAKWIYTLDTVSPKGLNDNISFAPYL